MEEKINNKRIFCYVPSLIAKIILESELRDEDVFFNKNNRNLRRKNTLLSPSKQKYSKVFDRYSVQANPEIFPLEYPLPHSIIMSVKLKGFQDLILTLGINDPKRQKVKLHCEFLPILTSKILLQMSSIITENGGEILKLEDFEFYAIWDFSNIDIKYIHQYQYFYSKHAIISAYEIMKKVDKTEIIKGYKIKISIGLAYGESSLFFFGGERRRSDFVLMGEAIEESEHCLNLSGPHEILIGREMNNFFKGKGEIATEQVGTDDKNKNIYKINIDNTDEYELKNFHYFKDLKLNSNYIVMNQKIYQNLSKKVYILSSVLPQGLVKYLDIGEDANLKELSIITIMTVHIIMDLDLIDNSRQIQYLIRDMQKATYLTRGSLLGVIKTFNGLMIRCVWGLEPNTFVDETARAIATSFAMKKLTNIYKIKISIGIATGCCFTGLINIQGNRKMYSLLGYKAIISRLLADKANRKNMKNKNNIINNNNSYSNNFIVYCDKATAKYSQKWYRYNYVNDLYMFNESKEDENNDISIKKEINDIKKKNLSQNKENKDNKDNNKSRNEVKLKRFKTINPKQNKTNFEPINNPINLNLDENKTESTKNNPKVEPIKSKNYTKIDEIYMPIEYDEYFFQSTLDPFPFIRTYKYNSHNSRQNTYSFYNYLNNHLKDEIANIDNSNKNLNNIQIINNDINDLPKTRHASKTMYIKRKTIKKGTLQDLSEEKQKNMNQKEPSKFIRIDSRFDSIKMNPTKKKTRKEHKNIYTMINRLSFNKNKSKDYKSFVKLKKSQTIIGFHDKVDLFLSFLNKILLNNKKQFFLIRGPLGIGKSLFIRKVLNNFIALNDNLGENYFNTNYQFLFCNISNPFTTLLPYNSFSFIFRKIYLLLKLDNKTNEILSLFTKYSMDDITIKNINFILSMGREDINLLNDYYLSKSSKKKNKLNIKKIVFDNNNNNNIRNSGKIKENKKLNVESIIKEYEGPFNYEKKDIINIFFYEMIMLYKNTLKLKTNLNNFAFPLIFLLDDIQLSDKYSISFIEFLFNKLIDNNNNDLNPFIFIMIQQTAFHKKYRGLNPIDLDNFININITFDYKKNYENKILCFDIKPIYDKNILRKIVIFHFKNSVFKQYGTELNVVDNNILDFLLTKSFNGIPFLVINLLKSLINSDKFIQILSGELIITSELKDESDIRDWNDILIPYIYEKITSNSINKILNFREILILKYASIIGTMFDIKTLDKINPLNSIIKIEDIIMITEKLNKEYFAELYNNDNQIKKNKLICQITFPFLREVLYQKFLVEARAPLHMKLAGIISMSKRIIYFSLDDEIKLLKKHLFNSEINIINEIKTHKTQIKTTKDILQTKKDLSFNNLKILLIKEICHNFYRFKMDNLLDGNLEMYNTSKSNWIRVYYIINTRKIIFYNQEDEKKKKDERIPILILGLNSIYRNELSMDYFNKAKNNVLEVCVSEEGPAWTRGFTSPRRKKEYFFSSEKIKDVYQLEIGINFLKMKVNYDTFTYYYGSTRFPLYKLKWFVKKEEKYFFDSENSFSLWNMKDKNEKENKSNNLISVEKLIDKSNGCQKNFSVIMKSTLGLFIGLIQENISNFNSKIKNKISIQNDNILYIQTPNHIKKILNKIFFLESFINKDSNSKSIHTSSGKKNDLNKSNYSLNNNIEEIEENNIKSMKKNNNNISDNNSFASSQSSIININKNENQSFKNTNRSNKELYIKLNSKEKSDKKSNNNEFKKFIPNTVKNRDNNINNNNNNNYKKYIYIPKISFPKNESSQINKKVVEEDEPIFTESNFNTNNNASLINGNDSTKLTYSTNKISISPYGDKNINESKGETIINTVKLNTTTNSKITNITKIKVKKKKEKKLKVLSPYEKNYQKYLNIGPLDANKKSRNKKNQKLRIRSYDNKYEKNKTKEEFKKSNQKLKKIKVLSHDDIYIKKGRLPGDFVPFKTKKELIHKHVNIILSDDSFDKKPIIRVYPSIKFNEVKSSQNLKYKKLGDDPKFMYVDYYKNNQKIHKSHLFDILKK